MLDTNDTISPNAALQTLIEGAPLQLEGAWRLDTSEGRRLTEMAGGRPAGGWHGVAALAAGCGVLKATREEFEAEMTVDEVADWTHQQTTRRLLEAFTMRLVPPTTAAGLFIMLSIHPAWGVHLAHKVHRQNNLDSENPGSSSSPTDLFPKKSLEVVGLMVSTTLGSIVGRLSNLDPYETHSVREFSEFIRAVCDETLEEARNTPTPQGGLAPLVDAGKLDSNWRVVDFTANDLLDSYLVPAGAASHTDATFRVDVDALADLDVFHLG